MTNALESAERTLLDDFRRDTGDFRHGVHIGGFALACGPSLRERTGTVTGDTPRNKRSHRNAGVTA